MFIFSISISFAQNQRHKHNNVAKDSSSAEAKPVQLDPASKKEMMKELNLSKLQKQRLKDIRMESSAKKDALRNDTQLKSNDRKEKLKALREEEEKKIMDELNFEQRAKMKQILMREKG